MKLRNILVPILATAIGLSLVQGVSAMTADELDSLKIQPTFKFKGRVQGYYKSLSTKDNDAADPVSATTFVGAGRFGVTGSVAGDTWSSRFSLEDNHAGSLRDAYVAVGNDAVEIKVGKFTLTGNLYPSPFVHMTNFNNGANDQVFGREPGLGVSVKGLPVSLDIAYKVYEDDLDDKTIIQVTASGSAADLSWNFEYSGSSAAENKGRSTKTDDSVEVDSDGVVTGTAGATTVGDPANTSSYTETGAMGKYKLGDITLGLALGVTSSADKTGGVSTTAAGSVTSLGIGFSLGDTGTIAGSFTTTSSKSDTASDATVASHVIAGYRVNIAGTSLRAGYSTLATATGSTVGKSGTNLTVGFQRGF